VISGIPSTKLAQIIPKTKQYHRMKELLNSIQGVDVVVVNLVYEPGVITEPGFGFLIPKQSDIQGPILGVIYDSCVFPQSNKTVCTVMMGGSKFRENEMWSKTSQEWTDLAIESMTRILGISSSKLITSNTTLQSKCIPQYTVDHRNRVDELMGYQNHLYLVGSSYQGVGINDIICNSYRTVQNYF
jgi:oxygen-dependent protoporphyrinogen oxidase